MNDSGDKNDSLFSLFNVEESEKPQQDASKVESNTNSLTDSKVDTHNNINVLNQNADIQSSANTNTNVNVNTNTNTNILNNKEIVDSNQTNTNNDVSSIDKKNKSTDYAFENKMHSGSRLPKENFKPGSATLPKVCIGIVIIGCVFYIVAQSIGVVGMGFSLFKNSGIEELISDDKQEEDEINIKEVFSYMKSYFDNNSELKAYNPTISYDDHNFIIDGTISPQEIYRFEFYYDKGNQLKIMLFPGKEYSKLFFVNTICAISKYNGNKDVTAIYDLLMSSNYFDNYYNITYISEESIDDIKKYYVDLTDDYQQLG